MDNRSERFLESFHMKLYAELCKPYQHKEVSHMYIRACGHKSNKLLFKGQYPDMVLFLCEDFSNFPQTHIKLFIPESNSCVGKEYSVDYRVTCPRA